MTKRSAIRTAGGITGALVAGLAAIALALGGVSAANAGDEGTQTPVANVHTTAPRVTASTGGSAAATSPTATPTSTGSDDPTQHDANDDDALENEANDDEALENEADDDGSEHEAGTHDASDDGPNSGSGSVNEGGSGDA